MKCTGESDRKYIVILNAMRVAKRFNPTVLMIYFVLTHIDHINGRELSVLHKQELRKTDI